MKKNVSFLVLLISVSLIGCTIPTSAYLSENTTGPKEQIWLTTRIEVVREFPSPDSKVIDVIDMDIHKVFLLERAEDWTRVRVHHTNLTVKEGWILSSVIRTISQTSPTNTRIAMTGKFLGLRKQPSQDAKVESFITEGANHSLFLIERKEEWAHLDVYMDDQFFGDFWVESNEIDLPPDPEALERARIAAQQAEQSRKKAQEEKERERKEKIKQLETKARGIPVANYAANFAIYGELLKLDPGNERYDDKRDFYFNKLYDRKQEEAQRKKREAKRRADRKRQKMADQGYDFELLSWHWSTGHGYVTAQGQVRNISSRRLENVAALVTWYDKDHRMITSDSSLIEYNPIMPGQASPFKVMERYNPLMQEATIEFKFIRGSKIQTYKSGD